MTAMNVHGKAHLLLRADQFHPYRLPANTLMPNMDVACSNASVAVRYWLVQDQVYSVILWYSLSSGEVRQTSPFPENQILSMPQLSFDSKVLFSSNSLVKTKGLWTLSESGQMPIPLADHLVQARSLTQPIWWNNTYLVRRLSSDGYHQLWSGSQMILDVFKEGLVLMHLPQVRRQQMLVSVMLGEPGEISSSKGAQVLQFFKGQKKVLVSTKDVDSNSPFSSLDNSPQPTGNGGMVFLGEHINLGRGLWFQEANGKRQLVAVEGEGGIQQLEYFAPSADLQGDVLFRAIDTKGIRHVYFWSSNHQSYFPVMSQGEKLILNDGEARVIDREGWPAFSGRPCLSDDGKIFIHAVLESADGQVNKGSGIFQIIKKD